MPELKLPPVLEARWNMRVEELKGDFLSHCAQVGENVGKPVDENRAFQIWCIQKLAMMQLAIEDQGRALELLTENDE